MVATIWLAVAAVAVVVVGTIIYWIGQRRGLGVPPRPKPKGSDKPPRNAP
jgi:hypothetical protein